MNAFKISVLKIIKSSGEAFKTFPAAIGFATAFAIVTMVRIQLEWPQQEPYNFMFNCLHWSFALGAILSLALITAAQSRINTKKAFLCANIIGTVATIITFGALYMFGVSDPAMTGSGFAVISNIAAARVGAIIGVSMLAFIYLAGYPSEESDFSKSFFMTHKAFFIATLYGGVVMAGASGVAGAVEVLLYNDMSSNVYMYIGTLAGLLAFTIFVGYFPDFRKGEIDEHRQVAQKQPRFVEVLFGYILVPIVLALTVVLLIWAGKTISGGMSSDFYRLYGIAAAFTIGGIWLHIMVSHYETGIAKFYKRIYPLAAMVILVFEAWALLSQLNESGLKFTEYAFSLIWILAGISVILLLVLKEKSHPYIAATASALLIIFVLPIIGYNALPVTAQSDRLMGLLIDEEMFIDGQIVAATAQPELLVRQGITDAVDYLAYANDAKLPSWFDKTIAQPDKFQEAMGFEQTWANPDYNPIGGSDYLSTSLYLQAGSIDISDYRWALNPQEEYQKGQNYVALVGDKASYDIYWDTTALSGIPSLRIIKGGTTILEQDMSILLDAIIEKYPLGQYEPTAAGIGDMSLKLSCQELSVLVVLRNADINLDPKQDIISYWINLESLYINEN